MTLYDYPHYYELATSRRNVSEEAAFVHACIQKFSGIPVKTLLEVGCGPAPHVGELVQRGYRYAGFDANRAMLDYATYRWRGLNPPPQFLTADMVNFKLDLVADFGFVMLGSLYVNSLQEMTTHFDSMATALRSGSLYLLDWCVQFSDPLGPELVSTVTDEVDGIRIESEFNARLVDPARQMYEEIWTVNIDDHGRRRNFRTIERNRVIFPQEFLLFLKTRSDFEFVGWWHNWDLNCPIDGRADVFRPVILIRRK